MDLQFKRNLVNQLERRKPVDNSYQPSRRYDGCMMPGEQSKPYGKVLIIIDGGMTQDEAARLFEHTAAAVYSARQSFHGTSICITLCGPDANAGGILSEVKRYSRSNVADGLTESYKSLTNWSDLNAAIDEASRLPYRFDLALFLTNGQFLNVFNEHIIRTPLCRNMLILLSENAGADAESKLRSLGLSSGTGMIRLHQETTEPETTN